MTSSAQPVGSVAPTHESLDELRRVAVPLAAAQLAWCSGYLAGLAEHAGDATAAQPSGSEGAASDSWKVLYGSQTGNGRKIAHSLQQRAEAAGVCVELVDMQDYRPAQLKREERLLIVISTHGEGDPPDPAIDFYQYLMSGRAPRVPELQFSVLALGDSTYHDFCETGRKVDDRLIELGGTRVHERVECDLDFEEPSTGWSDAIVKHASEHASTPIVPATLRAVPTAPLYDRHRPYRAQILERLPITGDQSTKDVRHVELEVEEGAMPFEPGDSLGVWPTNPEPLVEQLVEIFNFDRRAPVRIGTDELSIEDALLHRRDITRLSLPFLKAYAAEADSGELEVLIDGDRDQVRSTLEELQVVDLVTDHQSEVTPQWLVDALRPLTPRLYSIASSPLAVPDEVHLTVANVFYERFGRDHWGAASHYLSGDSTAANVFVESNERFRLPKDPDVPTIMIGAGTGIAPYRAFVQHRQEIGAQGGNWLFFGDRNFESDFLYQTEWLRHRRDGILNRLDVGFSRDSKEKVYVQHRIAEQARDVFDWIERGAHVYVCGDAKGLAVGVESALLSVIATQANLDDERASEYLSDLRRAGRYQRDVY